MTATEAKQYISYCIGEGIWDSEMFEGWNDEQMIEFAEKEMAKGDAIANDNENGTEN